MFVMEEVEGEEEGRDRRGWKRDERRMQERKFVRIIVSSWGGWGGGGGGGGGGDVNIHTHPEVKVGCKEG